MSTLYASAVRKNITPTDETRALWNKTAPKPFSAPIAQCWIQALVLSDKQGQTVVHLGGDLINNYPSKMRDTLEKEFGLKQSCIFFSSTHNHMLPDISGGPDGGGPPGGPGGRPGGAPGGRPAGAGGPGGAGGRPPMFGAMNGVKEWTDGVLKQAVDAVREATATLRPARIGAGKGVSGLSANREWDTPVGSLGTCDRNGDTYPWVSVLRVDEVGGKPIAVMVNNNCHAGSFFGGNVGLNHRLTGGDVAGWVSEFVGNAIGQGVVPIWAIGGAGDQNTYFHSGMMIPQVDAQGKFVYEEYVMKDDDAIALAKNAAAMQAQEALAVYNNITEFSTDFDLKSGIVYKTGKKKRVQRVAPGQPGGNALPGHGPTSPVVETEPPVYDDQPFRYYLILLNGIAFAGANSESFINLKKAALGVLPYDNVFWIDMNSDAKSGFAGYVPAPRFDPEYDQGKRHNLQGILMEYNGDDMLKLYADGMDELVKTIQ